MARSEIILPGHGSKINHEARGKQTAFLNSTRKADKRERQEPTEWLKADPQKNYSVGGTIVRGCDFAEGVLPVNAELADEQTLQRILPPEQSVVIAKLPEVKVSFIRNSYYRLQIFFTQKGKIKFGSLG